MAIIFISMNGIENFLPPHWIIDDCDNGEIYLNIVTGEKTTEHPLSRYNNLKRNIERSTGQERTEDFTLTAIEDFEPLDGNKGMIQERRDSNFDYHCQWSERDATGKVNNFGLTIRYFSHEKIMIKFDGSFQFS
jgi:hypothetical protein